MELCGCVLNILILPHKQKHKRRSQFHKLFYQSFIACFLLVLVKIRAFNNEILLMLIDHRILSKGNTVKMAGGDINKGIEWLAFACT